jgi:hypothetical protein
VVKRSEHWAGIIKFIKITTPNVHTVHTHKLSFKGTLAWDFFHGGIPPGFLVLTLKHFNLQLTEFTVLIHWSKLPSRTFTRYWVLLYIHVHL